MKSRKTRIGIFVVFALQCRVECPSVAFFIVYLCPSGKYSSETIEKLTFSYTFLYCEKQVRYLILICMFPIAGAYAEFSCHPEIHRVALLPFLYSVLKLGIGVWLTHSRNVYQARTPCYASCKYSNLPVRHSLLFRKFKNEFIGTEAMKRSNENSVIVGK